MRRLTTPEIKFISYLLNSNDNYFGLIEKLPYLQVDDMNDGGMGSLRFKSFPYEDNVSMKKEIARIDTLTDVDGIPLSITLNIGTDNELYELDIFKGDFSPLKQFPIPPED